MEESGYFVTSFPYKEGYEITVDGKNVQAEKVNCAFIGFSLGEGSHEIEITYTCLLYTSRCMSSIKSVVGVFGIILRLLLLLSPLLKVLVIAVIYKITAALAEPITCLLYTSRCV